MARQMEAATVSEKKNTWITVRDVQGGILVLCGLCGSRVSRRTFWAAQTNYAEARRLATAYSWEHEHSEEHRAAIAYFHDGADAPAPTAEDELLARIFGTPRPTATRRKVDAAHRVAESVVRQAGRTLRRP